jgi:Flp pilus assembly protein TadG
MMMRSTQKRRGAGLVEFAVIAPVLVAVLFGAVIGGLGAYRYHQVACLAREGARYASVHGLDYAREQGVPAATQDSIYNAVILNNSAGLDPAHLTCTVTWDKSNQPHQMLPDGTVVNNVVTVTVSYQWIPELLFGNVTLTSTSKMPMSY